MRKTAIYLNFFLVIFYSLSLKAQTFQKAYGVQMPDQQQLFDLTIDQNNSVYSSGTFRNLSTFPVSAYYGTVSKIDSSGRLLWYKGYLPSTYTMFEALFIKSTFQVDKNSVYCFGTFLGDSAGRSGYYLLKLDLNGQVIWSKFIEDEIPEEFARAIYGNNGIYAVMRNKVVKFNLDGNVVNSVQFNLDYLTLRRLFISKDGSLILTGDLIKDSKLTTPVIKLDADLNYIQGNLYSVEDIAAWGNAIAEESNNNIIIGTAEGISFSIDKNGKINWAKQIKTEQTDSTLSAINLFKDIQPLSAEGKDFIATITGEYYDNVTYQYYNVVCKLNQDGKLSDFRVIRKAPFPNNNNYIPSALKVDRTGQSFFLAGDLTDTAQMYHLNYLHRGKVNGLGCGEEKREVTILDIKSKVTSESLSDTFLVSYDAEAIPSEFIVKNIQPTYDSTYCFEPTGTASVFGPAKKLTNVKVYVKREQNELHILFPENAENNTQYFIEIYNSTGQIMMAFESDGKASEILPIDKLAKGVYYISIVKGDGNIYRQKFINQ